MKIIELLNKIANGEEVPKCIRYNNENYYFKDNEYRDFVNEEVVYSTLNDEIEIIEEPKKIEHIQIGYTDEAITNYKRANFNSNDMVHICRSIGFMMANINKINDKFNEIIDYINKGE